MVYLNYTESRKGYEVFRGSKKIAEIEEVVIAGRSRGIEIRPEPMQYATPEEVAAMRGFFQANRAWMRRRASVA